MNWRFSDHSNPLPHPVLHVTKPETLEDKIMTKSFAKTVFLILSASILAAQLAAGPANARTFKASEGAVKQACGGGTFFGKNKDGAYGCLSENGKAYTHCKKGKCETLPAGRVAGGEGKGNTGGEPKGGNDDGPSDGSNTNTDGNASMGNAGMSSSGSGGTIN
jgi:hypothetical protein